jgi:hypothetical protein
LKVTRGLVVVGALLCAIGCLLGATSAVAKPHEKKLAIQVLSNRADLVSAGDALVAVRLPKGVRAKRVHVKAGGKDVTGAFSRRTNGRFEGLVSNLPIGKTTLTATAPNARKGHLKIVDHPNGGPDFSGPQVQPWVCQATAVDKQCNQPPTYSFSYQNTTGAFGPYDPDNPPSDVAQTTTDNGKTVPFIIRTETGYQDRDQYEISVLYNPEKGWKPWRSQPQFNHKLLITHGASCGIDHRSGEAPSTTSDTAGVPGVPGTGSSPTTALGLGFAVMSTALDNAGHNCSMITQAESLVMAKERLVEQYGELRYTIGTGCSGGSLTQQQVANAYPGIYQGILPQCSFPDAWSTGNQLVDYHLTRQYFEDPTQWAPGVVWDPDSIAAVQGHPNYLNSIILDSLYFTAVGDPSNPCAGVSDAERYSTSNPTGVRCTLADVMINVFGPRDSDGYAGRPLDNVGVQYGLAALNAGTISKAQFLDLNEKIGGADINAIPTAERTPADEPALLNANRSGAINDASNLDQVAIIDLRGSDDGSFHDAYRAFSIRARLDREHGDHDNQVIWEGAAPLIGGADFTTKGLMAMDRWLSAVEKDKRGVGVAQKIAEDKPGDIVDHCELAGGAGEQPGTDCPAIVRVYSTPRIVAGDSIATDTNKCQLKPIDPADYGSTTFTAGELDRLRAVFPGGVCDYSKPAVDSATPTLPWMNYNDVVGGKPLPGRKVTTGWAARAFRSVRGPKAARQVARRALAAR